MKKDETTSDEILTFLREHMVTKEDFSVLEGKVSSLSNKVSSLPDKDYLDTKLADLEGVVITRQRKQENKTNRILEMLEKFEVLPRDEIEKIRAIHVFPPSA